MLIVLVLFAWLVGVFFVAWLTDPTKLSVRYTPEVRTRVKARKNRSEYATKSDIDLTG